jgi:hypothetical protein
MTAIGEEWMAAQRNAGAHTEPWKAHRDPGELEGRIANLEYVCAEPLEGELREAAPCRVED